jgi:hypothetical protein
MVPDEDDDEDDVESEGELPPEDIALAPNEAADPQLIVAAKVPQDIRGPGRLLVFRPHHFF